MSKGRVGVRANFSKVIEGVIREIRGKHKSITKFAPRQSRFEVEPLEVRLLMDATPATCCGGVAVTYYGSTPPIICTVCPCPGQTVNSNPNSGNTPAASPLTPNPVRYFDGQPQVDITDISSDGFGMAWGQSRSYDDSGVSLSTGQGANGNRWDSMSLPHIVEQTAGSINTLIVVSSGIDQRFYDSANSGVSYTPRDYVTDQLTHDATSNTYTVSDSSGGQTTFYGFGGSVPTLQQGQIKQYSDAAGNLTTTTYAASGDPSVPVGRLKTVFRENAALTASETWNYAYTSTASTANLSAVQWFQNGSATATRQVVYTYYSGSTAGGNAGDLQSATVEDGSSNVLNVDFYRYYTSTSGGYIGGLKQVFSYASYTRATAAGINLDTASDSTVNPYADNLFTYDTSHRVTSEVAQGAGCTCSGSTGQGTYLFSYSTNMNSGYSDNYNEWKYKTVVQFDDTFTGTNLYTNTIYSNYEGEVMLNATTDVSDPGNSSLNGDNWGMFYKYDSTGRVIWTAQPSALALPSSISTLDSFNDVLDSVGGNYVYMNDSSGLIDVNDFYATTTATSSTAGGVAGYFHDSYVQLGETGTPVLQETKDYFSHNYTPTVSTVGDTIYPVADDTVYGGTGGSDARKTSYAYTWQLEPGSLSNFTNRPATIVTTLPVISSGQNGPGVADTITDSFDIYGRLTSDGDGNGSVTTYQYDDGTGALTQMVQDSGSGRLNLTTTYVVDGLGRTIKETDPNGNVTYTVYNDANHEMRVYPGWNSTSHTTTGPIEVSRTYYPTGSGQSFYTETLTSSATPTYNVTTNAPTGAETISAGNIQALSRSITNNANQVIETDNYFSMSGTTYSQSSAQLGSSSNNSASGNYHATTYGYDGEGNVNRVLAPTGTITRTIYDNLSRVVSTWVGTNDSPSTGFWSPTNNGSPSNMTEILSEQFDANGVGDSDLTQLTQYVGGSASNRVSQYAYDWRDRQVAEKDGMQATEGTSDNSHPIFYTVYDNLGEVTEVDQYDADNVQLSSLTLTGGVPGKPSSSLLRAETGANYDDQGRVYESQQFSIDQGETGGTAGTPGSSLNTFFFYDHAGNLIATYAPGGIATKYSFDGAERLVKTSQTDGGQMDAATMNWTNANSLSTDVVFSQMLDTLDSDGNVILSVDKERFDNDTAYGDLGTDTTSTNGARVYYVADYYDAADRLTDSANVGNDAASVYTRPGTVPTRSDTALVTSYGYDSAGNQATMTDPRGIVGQTYFDMLGRTTETIADYTGGSPTSSTNQTTTYTYDGDNNVLTETAVMPSGTNSQTTAYIYGVTTTGSTLYSNDLLAKMEYPDPSTGAASTSSANDVSYAYNDQGQTIGMTDQNGTTHGYRYDVLGRMTLDGVTAGTGVDTSVLALGYTYDTGGRPLQDTSYSDAAGTMVVNQVQYAYDGWGQMVKEYQATAGSVNTSTSSYTGYNYTENAGGVNNDRLTSMSYPNGRILDYVYGNAEYPLTGITHSGTTATATMLSNVYSVGNSITISGASDSLYDGTFTITAVNNTSHTISYTMTGTPSASASGTDLVVTTPGTTQNGSISRVSALMDHAGTSGGVHLEEYTYLGLQTIVAMNRPEDHTDLTYLAVSGDTHGLNDGNDRYTGLDRFGRVDDQYWLDTTSGAGAKAVDRFQYGYDRDGDVLYKNNLGPSGTSGLPSSTAAAFSELYHANSSTSGDNNTAYDPLGRLTDMRRGALTSSGNNGSGVLDTVTTLNTTTGVTGNQKNWSLNAVGDWSSVTTDGTSASHTTNAQNETTAVGATTISYDNNGNVTSNIQGQALKYDAWNRIVQAQGTTYKFRYDALGRMVQYITTGTNTFYYDNQNQLIEEYVSGVYSQFVFGLAYINEVILRDSKGTGSSAFGIAGSGLNTREYDQQDANWNTTSLYETAGVSSGIIERFIYDPYGTPKTLTNAWASFTDTSIFWRFLYQGTYWLTEANVYIMGARDFDYTIGAWDQKDPIGYGDGMNDYQGFGSNPSTFRDPSGEKPPTTMPTAPPTTQPFSAPTPSQNLLTATTTDGSSTGTFVLSQSTGSAQDQTFSSTTTATMVDSTSVFQSGDTDVKLGGAATLTLSENQGDAVTVGASGGPNVTFDNADLGSLSLTLKGTTTNVAGQFSANTSESINVKYNSPTTDFGHFTLTSGVDKRGNLNFVLGAWQLPNCPATLEGGYYTNGTLMSELGNLAPPPGTNPSPFIIGIFYGPAVGPLGSGNAFTGYVGIGFNF